MAEGEPEGATKKRMVESLGWPTEPSITPHKHRTIEGAGAFPVLELKGHIYRSQEESKHNSKPQVHNIDHNYTRDMEIHRAKKKIAARDSFSLTNSGVDAKSATMGRSTPFPEDDILKSSNLSSTLFTMNLCSEYGGGSFQRPSKSVKRVKSKRKSKEEMTATLTLTLIKRENEKLCQTILACAQMKNDIKMLIRDDNIIMINLDTIRDPRCREYFRQEQQRIFQKRRII